MKTTFSVVGDMLAQRRIPAGYEGYEKVQEQITKGDARFVNLETTLHNGEYFGNQFSGGSYLRAVPETLDDVKAFGFNLLSFANNHSMDFAHGGLMATKRYVDAAGIANTGAGANLDEAAAPAYLDTPAGRVALISTCTMDNEAALAGKQSRRFPGRPGVNGMRLQEYIQVTEDQLRVIREIADASHVNAQKDIERAEGYFPPIPEGIAVLKDLQFKQGDETKYITHPHPEDMARVEKAIYEARMQADYILVSIHSHELSGDKKENPSDFLKEFAHRCIDAGAHAVLGHGPHLLRPLEMYKGYPIFYSLGDFVIHNECIPFAPEEMYAKQHLTSDATMRELFCDRSAGYTRGLMRDHRMLEAVIPYFEMEDGKLTYLELMPIELNFDRPVWQSGNPRFSKEHGIIERYAEMSAPYGCRITVDERGYGIVELKQ
ncbi:MAG: CapA family protein [Lachnospiraceae bacterium]|nr:CapA family protein [Lachnospiraceae bacterium]